MGKKGSVGGNRVSKRRVQVRGSAMEEAGNSDVVGRGVKGGPHGRSKGDVGVNPGDWSLSVQSWSEPAHCGEMQRQRCLCREAVEVVERATSGSDGGGAGAVIACA